MTVPASGYTQVPNWLIEAMPKLTGAQVMVCLAVARRTYGWQKDADTISLSQLQQDTGMERAAVNIAIQWLVETAGILVRTPATRGGFVYSLSRPESVPSGRKQRVTSMKNELVTSGMESELVRKSNQSLVLKANTQKKGKESKRDVADATLAVGAFEQPIAAGEITQPALLGLPEPLPPVAAPPPSPEKPRKAKTTRTPEEVALDEALAELCGLNWHAVSRDLRLGLVSKRKALVKAGATVETLKAMAVWWRKHSPVAVQRARRQDGPPSPPTLEQVGTYYQQAADWHAATVAHEAREQARREHEQRQAAEVAQRRAEMGELARQLNPFKAAQRPPASSSPAPAAPVALVARGRAT